MNNQHNGLYLILFSSIISLAFSLWNNLSANYYIDYIGSLFPFPYATNKCNPDFIVGGDYWIYECINGTHLMKSHYLESNCSDTPNVTIISKNLSVADTTQVGYFFCDGTDYLYAAIAMGIDFGNATDTCSSIEEKIFYGALSGCTINLNTTIDYSLYCDSTQAIMNFYNGSDQCTSSGIPIATAIATQTCGFVINITIPTVQTNYEIFGQIVECNTVPTPFPTPAPTFNTTTTTLSPTTSTTISNTKTNTTKAEIMTTASKASKGYYFIPTIYSCIILVMLSI